jgi:alpha-D-ribose 1-methylphosphonate 5-phosphate C-P lyase
VIEPLSGVTQRLAITGFQIPYLSSLMALPTSWGAPPGSMLGSGSLEAWAVAPLHLFTE